MKKIILLSSLLLIPFTAYAYPGVDMTVGGAPFAVLQETMFEKEECEQLQEKKDANGRPVIKRSNSVQGKESGYNLNDKKQPANLDFNSYFERKNEYVDPADMEFIQEDGSLHIKPVE